MGPERIVHLPKLRDVADDRVVEREAAPIAQLHDGDRRERLGDRGPVIHRVLRGCARGPQIATAIGVTRQHPARAKDHHTAADYAVCRGIVVEGCREGGPSGGRPRKGGRAGLRGRAAWAGERDRAGEDPGRAEGPRHRRAQSAELARISSPYLPGWNGRSL